MSTDAQAANGTAPETDGIGEAKEQTAPAPAEKAPKDDWTSGFDEETRDLIAKKGWKSATDMATSYREAERNQSQERERANTAERQAQQLAALFEQGTQQLSGRQTAQAEDRYQIRQLGELVEAGEVSYADAFSYLTEQVFPDIARAQAGQVMQPVAQSTAKRELAEMAANLDATYPDFKAMSDEVISLMHSEPNEYAGANGMKRAYAMVKADRDAKAALEGRRASRAETIDHSSASASQIQDQEKAIRDRIRGAMPAIRDGI